MFYSIHTPEIGKCIKNGWANGKMGNGQWAIVNGQNMNSGYLSIFIHN